MLRFWIQIGFWLTAGFAVFGALVSRPWDWPEYASPELYVVYFQVMADPPYPYYLVTSDGSGQQWDLKTSEGAIKSLDCSPDGRTLAFLLSNSHLYVENSNGNTYEQHIDTSYRGWQVTNNGEVVLYREYSAPLSVISGKSYSLVPPEEDAYEYGVTSSSGITLWSLNGDRGIDIVAPTGDDIAFLPHAFAPVWLASEQIFSFQYRLGYDWPQEFLFDTRTHDKARLVFLNGTFSPDATEQAISYIDPTTLYSHIALVDALAKDVKHVKQIGFVDDILYEPRCFLTFRPQMLLANPQ